MKKLARGMQQAALEENEICPQKMKKNRSETGHAGHQKGWKWTLARKLSLTSCLPLDVSLTFLGLSFLI